MRPAKSLHFRGVPLGTRDEPIDLTGEEEDVAEFVDALIAQGSTPHETAEEGAVAAEASGAAASSSVATPQEYETDMGTIVLQPCGQYALYAQKDYVPNECVGVYWGNVRSHPPKERKYAVQLSKDAYIDPYPLPVQLADRIKSPLPCMNEPSVNKQANCVMRPMNLPASYVQGGDANHFYKALVCFACDAISKGTELTWHYGKTYDEIRKTENYEAGKVCELDFRVDDARLLQSVRKTYPEGVPSPYVHATRFTSLHGKKRAKQKDEYVSSSEDEYVPAPRPRGPPRERVPG